MLNAQGASALVCRVFAGSSLAWVQLVSMGESARLSPYSSFYVVSNAILSCKSFKTRVNFILIKSCKSMGLTSFFDQYDPLSMRCSLNLQLRSAHEKPQQPNQFDSGAGKD